MNYVIVIAVICLLIVTANVCYIAIAVRNAIKKGDYVDDIDSNFEESFKVFQERKSRNTL